MAESDRIMAAMLAAADAAELLPYVPDEPYMPPALVCNHLHRVGGLFFTIACGGIAGQTLPPVDQVWLALSAFDHLTTNVPGNQSKIDPKSVLATVLRRRMRFLELLVRVSMTRQCDWQTSLYHRPVVTTTATAADIPQQPDQQQMQQQFNWRHVLHKLTGDTWSSASTHRALSTLRWSHPRFLIQWDHDPIPENFPDMLETFLMGVCRDPDDKETETENTEEWLADETLQELLADSPAAAPSHRIVELGVSLCDGRVTTSLLFNIIEVLERFGRAQQQTQAQQKTKHRTRIEFRVTSLMFTGLCVMAGSAIENLGGLVRNSRYLHLQELRLTQLSDVEDQCLQRCLANLTSPAPPATKRSRKSAVTATAAGGLKRLMIEHDAKPSFAVMGAAVRCGASATLQEITVAHSAVDMRSVAAWLAFAFFHADSDSHVHKLCLRMAGSDEFNARVPPYATCSPLFVATFTHVLRRVVASEELAPLDAKTMKSAAAFKRKRDAGSSISSPSRLEEIPLPDDKRVFVELKRSTKARMQPRTNSPVIAILAQPMVMADDSDSDADDSDEQLQPPQQYQVIRRLHGWLAVVVPGYGAGWIPHSAVVEELLRDTFVPRQIASGEAAAPLPAPMTNRRITSFSWIGGTLPVDDVLKEEHADALMELLAVMGNPLSMLQLPCMWLHNQHVAPILTHCPRLEELNLYGNRITDLAPLVAAYETGACRISGLSVGQHSEIHDVVVRQCGAMLKMCNQHGNRHSTTSTSAERAIQRPTLQRLVLRITPFDYFRLGHYLSDVIPAIDEAIAQDPKLEYVRILCDMQDYGNLRIEIERLQAQRMLVARTATTTATATTTETERETPGAGDGAVAPPAATEDGMRSRPLPLPCKLAMVSVVHHASTQHSALSGMDAGVLAVVFGLARTCQPRVVDFFADQIML